MHELRWSNSIKAFQSTTSTEVDMVFSSYSFCCIYDWYRRSVINHYLCIWYLRNVYLICYSTTCSFSNAILKTNEQYLYELFRTRSSLDNLIHKSTCKICPTKVLRQLPPPPPPPTLLEYFVVDILVELHLYAWDDKTVLKSIIGYGVIFHSKESINQNPYHSLMAPEAGRHHAPAWFHPGQLGNTSKRLVLILISTARHNMQQLGAVLY